MVDQAAAAAAKLLAATQRGIQAVEQVRALLDFTDLHLAEHRPDGALDVPLVHAARGEVEVGHLKHLVEQLAELRLGLGLPPGRYLSDEPVSDRLRLLVGRGLLVQVPVTLCYRILADRDSHLVAGTVRADVPSGFPHGPRLVPSAILLAKVEPVTGE